MVKKFSLRGPFSTVSFFHLLDDLRVGHAGQDASHGHGLRLLRVQLGGLRRGGRGGPGAGHLHRRHLALLGLLRREFQHGREINSEVGGQKLAYCKHADIDKCKNSL